MTIGFDLGAKMVTLPRFDIPSYLKAIDDHKVYMHSSKQIHDSTLKWLNFNNFVLFYFFPACEAHFAAHRTNSCSTFH